jgi:hypothetical protein
MRGVVFEGPLARQGQGWPVEQVEPVVWEKRGCFPFLDALRRFGGVEIGCAHEPQGHTQVVIHFHDFIYFCNLPLLELL